MSRKKRNGRSRGKQPKKVQKSENAGKVRSLHHIDDDDYDELPEIKSEVKGANQTLLNGEKVSKKDEKPKLKD